MISLFVYSSDTEDDKSKGNKVLSSPVCLGSLAENFEDDTEEVSSIWMKQRESASVSLNITKFKIM